jgi:GNAT superfamily N-acetyltransferase
LDRPIAAAVGFRRARARDSEFAYRLKKATLAEYVRQVWGWDEDVQRRLHQRRFTSQDFRVIVASGVDVGILALSRWPDCLKVNQLLVLPEHQGRGIGTACVKHVLEEAAADGLPVRLQVLQVNRRAVEFYRWLGFGETGHNDTHVQLENPA